jgi:hypothetical protein
MYDFPKSRDVNAAVNIKTEANKILRGTQNLKPVENYMGLVSALRRSLWLPDSMKQEKKNRFWK